MHILIINRYALTPQQAGGTRHYSLARELQNLGNKLQLVAGSSEITKIKHEDFFTYLPLREGVSYFSRLTAMVKFFFQIVRYKSWLKDKPDVIIGTSPDLFQAFAAWWVAHRLKIPFVLEVRDLWPDSLIQLGNMSPWHPLILLFRRMEMWLYRRAQRIVSVLPNLTRYLHHQLKLQKPILILPNFYDSESTNVEIKNELKAKPFRVIYTGTFNLANDVELILAAAERMQTLGDSIPTVEFVLIGKGVFTEKLRAIIKEKNLTRVHLIASVPKKELHHHLQAAHASVMIFRDLPIYQFGVSPNKLFDYMAHGLPVILAIAAHENPVSQAQCGIVIPPHNPKALVDAIVQLASMPQTSLEEMGLRGQRFVADYHCLAQFAQRLQAFIRQEVSMC